jgi:hypothetical protein
MHVICNILLVGKLCSLITRLLLARLTLEIFLQLGRMFIILMMDKYDCTKYQDRVVRSLPLLEGPQVLISGEIAIVGIQRRSI